ncbi:MAG: hypothetical protein LBP58_04020 [Azoarcus sp.]|nr:hypothetical protein [Azoarcus sp.]
MENLTTHPATAREAPICFSLPGRFLERFRFRYRHNPKPDTIVYLLSHRMGEAASEDRSCMLLQRGKDVLPILKKMDAVVARARCDLQWLRRVSVSRDPSPYPDVKVNDVCNEIQHIELLRDRSIRDIEAGKTCWPWDLYD